MTKRATEESQERGEPIHTKYRPRRLKEVLGQGATVKSLEALLDGKSVPHCYLFTGPPGTGKTTLARIIADRLDIDPKSIVEHDAASNSGIDDMRTLLQPLRYNGFGESPNRAIILNECHGLSKQAWDALLTTTEEPPGHAYFFFTSTNPEKIPKAMVTRCTAYHLAPVRHDDLMDLLETVCKDEGYKTSERILGLVAAASGGSPRQALTLLAKVYACEAEDEARLLLQASDENAEVIDLARSMVKGDLSWKDMTATLKKLDEQGISPESVRLIIVNYLNACLMGGKLTDKATMRLLDMLECFMKPAAGPEKMAPLLIAFGRYIYPA